MAADASIVGAHGASSGTSVSTTAGAVSAGDTLIAIVSYDPGATLSSVTINGSGSDTFGAAKASLQGQGRLAAYVKENATGGGSVSVTVNFTGSPFPVVHLLKATGVATASFDSASLASGTDSTSAYTLASNAPAQSNNIWIAAIEQNSGSNGAYASSNFTILSDESSVSSFWTSGCGKLYSTAGTAVTPSFTRANSSNAASAIIVFALKEAAGGGGGVSPRPLLLRGVG